MTIARIISIGIVASFALLATFDATYALGPCCGYRNGVYVNLKTGKAVTPPASVKAAAPKASGAPASSGGGGGGGHK